MCIRDRVAELEVEVEEGQEYTRRNNLVVYGVPLSQYESDPIQVAIDIAARFDFQLTPDDIDAAHRLKSGKKENQDKASPPPFIMRLVHRHKKAELIRRAKEANKKELDATTSENG